MVLVGFGVLLTSLVESNYSVPYTLGAVLESLFIVVYVHLLLAYPSGELMSRHAKRLVGAGYAVAVLAPLFDAMFPEDKTCKPHACPDNLLTVSRDHGANVAQTAVWT